MLRNTIVIRDIKLTEPSRGHPPQPTRRERARAATIDEIKATALDLMREQGTTDVRFTDIARVMGMTAPALYRYFDDRDELLTALITRRLPRPRRPDRRRRWTRCPPRTTWPAAGSRRGSAYRDWARTEPQQFALVLGMPVPGYVAPDEGPTTEAAKAAMGQLAEHLRRGGGSGRLGEPLITRGLPGRRPMCAEGQARRADRHRAAGELPGHDADLGDAARLRQPRGLRPLRLAGARTPATRCSAATSAWPPRPPGSPSRPPDRAQPLSGAFRQVCRTDSLRERATRRILAVRPPCWFVDHVPEPERAPADEARAFALAFRSFLEWIHEDQGEGRRNPIVALGAGSPGGQGVTASFVKVGLSLGAEALTAGRPVGEPLSAEVVTRALDDLLDSTQAVTRALLGVGTAGAGPDGGRSAGGHQATGWRRPGPRAGPPTAAVSRSGTTSDQTRAGWVRSVRSVWSFRRSTDDGGSQSSSSSMVRLVERLVAGEHPVAAARWSISFGPRADQHRGHGVAGEVGQRAGLGHEAVDADDQADAVDQVGPVRLAGRRPGWPGRRR